MLPVWLIVLNALDAWLTLVAVHHGATEANPLARALLDMGPWWFAIAKVTGVTLATLVLHRLRAHSWLVLTATVYAAVVFRTGVYLWG